MAAIRPCAHSTWNRKFQSQLSTGASLWILVSSATAFDNPEQGFWGIWQVSRSRFQSTPYLDTPPFPCIQSSMPSSPFLDLVVNSYTTVVASCWYSWECVHLYRGGALKTPHTTVDDEVYWTLPSAGHRINKRELPYVSLKRVHGACFLRWWSFLSFRRTPLLMLNRQEVVSQPALACVNGSREHSSFLKDFWNYQMSKIQIFCHAFCLTEGTMGKILIGKVEQKN